MVMFLHLLIVPNLNIKLMRLYLEMASQDFLKKKKLLTFT